MASQKNGTSENDVEIATAKLKRGSTMVVTTREGELFVSSCGSLDTDARTRGQQQKITDISNPPDEDDGEPTQAKRVKLHRDGTMVATIKDGEEFLAKNPCHCEADTAHSQDTGENPKTSAMDATALEGAIQLEVMAESQSATQELANVDDKPPSLDRVTTMRSTAAEGAAFLDGKELCGTRSATDAVDSIEQQSSCTTLKRQGTMGQTAEDGKLFVERSGGVTSRLRSDEDEVEEAPKNLKRTHTMAETLMEGGEFLHRHDNQ